MKSMLAKPEKNGRIKNTQKQARSMKTVRALVKKAASIILIALLLPKTAGATTVEPPDFATLVGSAEAIFRGRVLTIRSEWAGTGETRGIVSHVTFSVLKKLKGNVPSEYVLTMLGGTVGGDTLEVSGAPQFKVGDVSLLFVQNNGTQFVPLVGIMHGHFKVAREAGTGEERLIRFDGTLLKGPEDIDATSRMDPTHEGEAEGGKKSASKEASGPVRPPIRLQDFENQVSQKIIEIETKPKP